MFATFNKARQRKPPRWAAPLLGAVVFFHVALFVGMWVKNIWDIEHLDRPKAPFDLAIAAAPPPPPAPPPAGSKPHDVIPIVPKVPVVRDLVQPVHIEHQVQQPAEVGDHDGQIGGTNPDGPPDGVIGGIDGPGEAPPVKPPPQIQPQLPMNIAPPKLEASRIAGEKLIAPTEVTQLDIQRSGATRVVGAFKLCITTAGEVNNVSMIKSTGFPAYDATITTRIRNEWRYRPVMLNGMAVPVCTAVTFIFTQH
jgi:hypothetical protein